MCVYDDDDAEIYEHFSQKQQPGGGWVKVMWCCKVVDNVNESNFIMRKSTYIYALWKLHTGKDTREGIFVRLAVNPRHSLQSLPTSDVKKWLDGKKRLVVDGSAIWRKCKDGEEEKKESTRRILLIDVETFFLHHHLSYHMATVEVSLCSWWKFFFWPTRFGYFYA